ncbi:response regulator receiver modulated diguanylate cyclase/phosphodiesterase with PAS/PAC sensor(s) [Chroococcus sp. FPU101]|nr:response regulator receiver modulated diguanylate cyclase/phosphodiesterase with PAS/PAC sensor(s) [Chroococcus sp. FPU101]
MALRGIKAVTPELILLDIKLPDYDGYEICRRIKADPQTADIPVIFLSALNYSFDKVQGFALGGADYIAKPFHIEEVLARVETHLTIGRLQKTLKEQNYLLQQQIEERKRIEKDLFAEKELAQVTLQSIGDAVITTDALGNVKNFNPIAEQLTGWLAHEVKDLPLSQVFQIINEITRKSVINPITQAIQENCIVGLSNHTALIARDGTEYAIEDSAAPIHNREGEIIGAVMVFHDVSESRRLSRQLSWQASHDALTGLINRREFEQQVTQVIASANSEEQQHALCYMDLDQFKIINDTCGHAAGDELLRQVTSLLQQRVRVTDLLARLGGDEFGLLLHQCTLKKAIEIAETLKDLIQDFRFIWQGKPFVLGVSIGVVAIDQTSQNLMKVLSEADAACYAAKAEGRNCVRVYSQNDDDLIQQRGERHLIATISQALENNRFRLYCQRIVSIVPQSKLDFFEILLRLLDENDQLISPAVFIPAAERYGLMPKIDRWVINTFFSHYHSISQPHVNSKSVYSINLSGMSVSNDQFHRYLVDQFTRYQIPSSSICFEITETVAISNFPRANQLINELQKLGCHFALDDFGSGMCSFMYLKNLPVDYLKIDGSFVKKLTESSLDRTMIQCFQQIAQALKIKTVAEWVENTTILEELKDIGIDYAQGYGIEPPFPLIL